MKMEMDGTFSLERGDDAFPCPKCSGYSPEVTCTPAERREFGCHIDRRPGSTSNCCSIAFVCTKCGHRFAMRKPAPDCEW